MTKERRTLNDLVNRKHHDPRFNALVELLVAHMIEGKWAPDEIRDAAYVASIQFMQMHPVRDIIYTDDLTRLPEVRWKR